MADPRGASPRVGPTGEKGAKGSYPHTRKRRGVAEGSLDLAIAWVEEADIERYNLAAHLLRYESLEAVMPGPHLGWRAK